AVPARILDANNRIANVLRERYVKRILPASGGCSIVACGKGGRRDEAAGTKQASTAEVEEVDFRAGAGRAECGGVLPGARVGRVTFLLVEEAAAGGGVGGAGHAADEIRGSEAGRGGARVSGDRGAAGRGQASGNSAQEWAEPAGRVGI